MHFEENGIRKRSFLCFALPPSLLRIGSVLFRELDCVFLSLYFFFFSFHCTLSNSANCAKNQTKYYDILRYDRRLPLNSNIIVHAKSDSNKSEKKKVVWCGVRLSPETKWPDKTETGSVKWPSAKRTRNQTAT